MPLIIPDETLRALRMTEEVARVEIACRLFDAGQIAFGHAAKFARLDEAAFGEEIERRGIPRYRYTAAMLEEDLETIRRMKEAEKAQEATGAGRR